MTVIKKLLDNSFYFWLIGLSFVVISYFSIYNALVLDNFSNSQIIEKVDSRIGLSLLKQGLSSQYFLIPLNFIKLFASFIIGQVISISILNYFYKINLSSRYFIFFTFLIGCLIHYFFSKLF